MKVQDRVKRRSKLFARTYVASKYNAVEAALAAFDVKSRKVASAVGTEYLAKPVYKRAIEREMERQGLDDSFITEITKRNAKQAKSYAASNGAIEIYHRIKGSFAPEKTQNLYVSVDLNDPEAVEKRLMELRQLLQEGGRIGDNGWETDRDMPFSPQKAT